MPDVPEFYDVCSSLIIKHIKCLSVSAEEESIVLLLNFLLWLAYAVLN